MSRRSALPRHWTRAERLLAAALSACVVLTGAALTILHREMEARRAVVEERLRRHAGSVIAGVNSDLHDALQVLRASALRAVARAEQAPGMRPLSELLTPDAWAIEPHWPYGIALGPGFRVGPEGVRTVTQGRAVDSTLLSAALAAPAPRFRMYPDRIVARGADTVLFILDSLPDGSWRGAEVPMAELRDRLWRPRLAAVEAGSRWAAADSTMFGPNDTLVAYAIHRGPARVPLLVHGDTARTRWRMTIQLIDLDDVYLTLTLLPPMERLLVPGGLPPATGPRLVLLGAAALLVIGLSGWLAWRALALSRAREAFAASITHELRTPLTGITLFAETLLLDRVSGVDGRRRALQTIAGEAQRLSALVENVLTMARRGQAEERLSVRETSLGDLLRSTEDAFAPMLATRALAVRFDTAGPDTALVDPDATRRILVNLIDNALRHAADATTVTVEAIHDERGVTLVVADDGVGIPPREGRRLWHAWEHGPSGGSGLGLAVVARLAALHGGTARLAPSSRGARFEVTLATGVVP